MTKHVHFTALMAVFILAVVLAGFGTAHLAVLSSPDSRLSRALVSVGF